MFGSRANPHYYFENRPISTHNPVAVSSYQVMLIEMQSDWTGGVFWKGRSNYFRRWWLEFTGLSFLENRPGWGHGVQHEGRVTLSFREFLFNGRLDLGMKLWGHVWGGRRGFMWDPTLGLGYEDYRDGQTLYPQDFTGIVNVRFDGVVQTFEIAFTVVNLLYAGRSVVENVTGSVIPEDQLTLAATPLFPPAGRLVFLEFSWRFRD